MVGTGPASSGDWKISCVAIPMSLRHKGKVCLVPGLRTRALSASPAGRELGFSAVALDFSSVGHSGGAPDSWPRSLRVAVS